MTKFDRITPEGTRDILFEECEAQNRITDRLREVFCGAGYREVKTPGFEFYDVFAAKSDYFPQESIYKFSDTRGRLVAVRPDSTIPIARLTATKLRGHELPLRLFYQQRVYRQQQEHRGRSGEILQMGVELIGASTFASDTEMLRLAAQSLAAASPGGYRIEIGHVGFYKLLMASLDADREDKALIHSLIASKNYAGLGDILEKPENTPAQGALTSSHRDYENAADTRAENTPAQAGRTAEILRRLPALFGDVGALQDAYALVDGYAPQLTEMLDYLARLFEELGKSGISDHIMIDFGLVNEAEYYSSLVFRGYIEDAGVPVLSGGRYDDLFADFDEDFPATGFALNIDLLTAAALRAETNGAGALRGISPAEGVAEIRRTGAQGDTSPTASSELIRVALTKGRLEDSFVALMERAGYDVSCIREKGRKLLLPVPGANMEVFLAKASDVVTYVEHGVCDIGVVGKDTIVEQGGIYYEIMDLGIGKCRFALAAPAGADFFTGYGTRVIATKYPNVAGRYFESKGMDVEIIRIEGSVELAPLLQLADGIVDIVETGTTLRENGLAVIEEIRNISARLIVNVTGMKLKKKNIDAFTERLTAVLAVK